MSYKANLAATLLTACLSTAFAADALVHLETKGENAENGKSIDMEFTEVERRSDTSIVQVIFRSGGSVSSSLFILRGMCSVARARGERYFKSTRLPAPEGRYIVGFPQDAPSAYQAAPSGEVFSVLQCDRLGF